MNNVDKFFQESHYNIIRVLLSISGLWPFHSVTKRCAIYFGFLLVLGSGLTFEVLGIIEVWADTFEVVNSLPLLLYALLSIIKTICLIYTLSKMKILLIKMKEYWQSSKSNEETKILDSYAEYGRKFSYAYTGILLGHSVFFILATLVSKFFNAESNEKFHMSSKIQNHQTGIPYRVNYLVDLDTYYVPIFIHTAMCEFLYTVLLTVHDVLYLIFVQYCCGLFAALRYRLENTSNFKYDVDNLIKTLTQNTSYSNIAYSIRRHTEAIQFITILESIYRLPLLLHVGCTVSILSIVAFQMTSTEDADILKHGLYLSGTIMNAFFENWQGQKIINYTEKVYESAYNAKWYKMPNATKKLLIMVIMRGIKPSKITAGKFIVMSYITFNAVIRLSSSYFMLLRSI